MKTALELCGYACFAAAGWFVHPALALVVAGACCLNFALEK